MLIKSGWIRHAVENKRKVKEANEKPALDNHRNKLIQSTDSWVKAKSFQ